MTKRQTRLFFIGGTGLFAVIFLAMTVDSHRQFGKLTNADRITPEVSAGKDVWHRGNCINCHTLLGEGAYYAPDLTKITQARGAAYLTAFLQDPSRFYSEQQHRRLMPNPNLTDTEIAQVIAFLDWVSRIDNQGWPPRPILVSGGTFPGTEVTPPTGTAPSDEPVVLGSQLFKQAPASCSACHSTAPGVNLAGPSLAGIGSRAEPAANLRSGRLCGAAPAGEAARRAGGDRQAAAPALRRAQASINWYAEVQKSTRSSFGAFPLDLLGGEFLEVAEQAVAGVVHQDVDAAEPRDGGIRGPLRLGLAGDDWSRRKACDKLPSGFAAAGAKLEARPPKPVSQRS